MDFRLSKRRRVYSPEPHSALRATFSQNYVNYLLPALSNITSNRTDDDDNDHQMEKMVKFQVDMALAVSADGFMWSHALKQKLQTEVSINLQHGQSSAIQPTPFNLLLMSKHGHEFNSFFPSIPKPLTFCGTIGNPRPKLRKRNTDTYCPGKRKEKSCKKEEKEFDSRVTTLRSILPGGEGMGVCELLSEVEGYAVCLELQVRILRSLVAGP